MTPQILHKLNYHVGSVNAGIFDPTGEYIVTGGQDKAIRLCNAQSGRLVQTYEGHGWAIQDLAVSSDSTRMASCGGDRSIFLWDVETAQVNRKFAQHQQRVDCVALNSDASIVVSGSFDKTVMVWDARSSQRAPLQVLSESRDSVSSVRLTDKEIIAGSIDGSVRIYDIRAGKLLVNTLDCPVVSVAAMPSGVKAFNDTGCLLVGCMDGSIQLLEHHTGTSLGAFSGHQCKEYRIRCDANRETVVSGSEDHYVYLWNISKDSDTGSYSARLSGHTGILAYGSLCHSAYWGTKLENRYMVEITMTTSLTHHHLVYETALPKPYRIVHMDEDGDDAEDPDDLAWINRGHEEKAKRKFRLKVTVDDQHQVQEVACG
ncbi:hypothetical protein EV179_001345 [Coemansia sp. RSA 487]|nr:hypothetical protein LPJ74_001787 [Coemansia sp. RSA 1843]KAJ2090593.1 hypothetical protein IW138_002601 [Coemansia sp. RSA 986]KAJ2216320.1 hypothetical protein EV179_001345 [Coemansia sp. RSA 487]